MRVLAITALVIYIWLKFEVRPPQRNLLAVRVIGFVGLLAFVLECLGVLHLPACLAG